MLFFAANVGRGFSMHIFLEAFPWVVSNGAFHCATLLGTFLHDFCRYFFCTFFLRCSWQTVFLELIPRGFSERCYKRALSVGQLAEALSVRHSAGIISTRSFPRARSANFYAGGSDRHFSMSYISEKIPIARVFSISWVSVFFCALI